MGISGLVRDADSCGARSLSGAGVGEVDSDVGSLLWARPGMVSALLLLTRWAAWVVMVMTTMILSLLSGNM
jgi:hypothetical protein